MSSLLLDNKTLLVIQETAQKYNKKSIELHHEEDIYATSLSATQEYCKQLDEQEGFLDWSTLVIPAKKGSL